MAGKSKNMYEIKQVLLMHQRGVSNRKISAKLLMSKDTVNSYVNQAKEDSLSLDELVDLEDTVLEHRFKKGNPAYTDPRFEELKGLLPYLAEEMKRRHVTLKQLWAEYLADHPGGYSLTQFSYHYNQHVKASEAATPKSVLQDLYKGGEQLFLDFAGDRMSYTDIETGEEIRPQTFVAVLPASDYAYVLCVPSQKTEDFVYACVQCFHAIGGVPQILVPDNLKAAVVKTDRYEPKVNEVMNDMANHYHAVVMPARPVHPKDKSNAEDMVKLVYRRVYAVLRNKKFHSLAELNKAVQECVLRLNQTRMQQYDCSREERFLAIDKPGLLPLPEKDFEIIYRASLKVQGNNFIYLSRDKHYYSVPYRYIGCQTDVIYTRSTVKVFYKGEQIAMHIRNYAKGGYTYEQCHLASNVRAYREKSPEHYVSQGKAKLEILGTVMERMFSQSSAPVETLYRSCDGLLHLQRMTDPAVLTKACEAAILYGKCNYGFINDLCQTKCAGLENETVDAPAPHSNIRGNEYFG